LPRERHDLPARVIQRESVVVELVGIPNGSDTQQAIALGHPFLYPGLQIAYGHPI
jgi:hypothetical protein